MDASKPRILDISVVIPAYNAERYIGDTLKTILSQKPKFKRVIVVDDGSTDATRSVVQGLDDGRITYQFQANQGPGPARNAGVSLADTEYILFVDADDILVPGLTTFLADNMGSGETANGIICFSSIDFDHKSNDVLRSTRHYHWSAPGTYESGRQALYAAMDRSGSGGFPVVLWLFVFRKALLSGDPPLRFLDLIHEDITFVCALFFRCGQPVLVTNEVFYNRRIRQGSITQSRIEARDVPGYLAAAKLWSKEAFEVAYTEREYYFRQAWRFYCQGLRYAALAHLPRSSVRHMIEEWCPEFLATLSLDYLLMRVYRRLATVIIRGRGSRTRRVRQLEDFNRKG